MINSRTALSVPANATGWSGVGHLIDATAAAGRRVRITTPFGTVTSLAGDGFTVSATPQFMTTAQGTFAGGGYDGGANLYDQSDGNLYLNGGNFRGVRRIGFYSSAAGDGNFTADPANPPAGVSFNVEGTRIIIDEAVLPAGWIGKPGAWISLSSVAGKEANSTTIQTRE